MKKIYLLIIMTFLLNNRFIAQGQSINPFVIASAGGSFVSANSQLSWTLGEVVTSTFTNGNANLTQGFQQSTYIINSINEIKDVSLFFSAYPNPTSNYVTINWQSTEEEQYSINVINNNGICVFKKMVNSSDNYTELDLNCLPNAIYILKINAISGRNLKIFKIIKI